MSKKINTLLADDHKLFCDGLEQMLHQSDLFSIVGRFHDGYSVLTRYGDYQADLLVLDIELPGINGLEVLRRIRLQNSALKIVMLSMHDEAVYIRNAKESGANGYVNKSIAISSLLENLGKIIAGEAIFDLPAGVPDERNRFFSRQETRILKELISGKTSEEIAQTLHISRLTVKTHRSNMMRKLKVHNSASLISSAFAKGIV